MSWYKKRDCATLIQRSVLQVFDKILAKKFGEQIVSLLLRMYEPISEGSDISQFTKLVSFCNRPLSWYFQILM